MMIFEIIADIRTFLLILAVVVVGFANAFYVILSKTPHGSYSTPYIAVRSSFSYMLGGYDLDELDASPTPVVLSLLWTVFMIIVSVVLLNVLIAIISDSFARLTALSIPNWRLEKAKIVLSCYALLSKQHKLELTEYLQRNPYLQVLKPTAVLQSEGSDEWHMRVSAMVKQVRAAIHGDIREVKADISALSTTQHAGVTADVSSVKLRLDSVTEKVVALQNSVDTNNDLLRQLIAEMRSSSK
jgi:Ion transport protein